MFPVLGGVVIKVVPPSVLYVKVYGAVPLAPVKVIFGLVEFLQTAVVPDIVAVGKALTVTVAEPVKFREQLVAGFKTLTN